MPNSNFKDHLIDDKVMKTLVNNFETKNYVSINSKRPSSKPDSKQCTFDLDVLADYLDFVRTEAKNNGYSNVKIAIKYGQYPEDAVLSPMQKPNTLGYQTVFLEPVVDSNGTGGSGAKINGLNFGSIAPPY